MQTIWWNVGKTKCYKPTDRLLQLDPVTHGAGQQHVQSWYLCTYAMYLLSLFGGR